MSEDKIYQVCTSFHHKFLHKDENLFETSSDEVPKEITRNFEYEGIKLAVQNLQGLLTHLKVMQHHINHCVYIGGNFFRGKFAQDMCL